MAGIMEAVFLTGKTLYAQIRNDSGQIWNGSAFGTFSSGGWSTYDVALTEQSSSSYYSGTFPAGAARGEYSYYVFNQLTTTGAEIGDAASGPVNVGHMSWDGSSKIKEFEPTLDGVTLTASQVAASLTANQTGVTIEQVDNLGASATAQVNAQVDTALSDVSVTANAMNTIVTNLDRAVSSAIVASMTTTVVLNNLAASATAQINAEVVDVLKTDTIAERSQGQPTDTPTFEEALSYVYMVAINKIDVTSSFKEFHNAAGTVIWKKTLSDDGTTYSEAKGATGP